MQDMSIIHMAKHYYCTLTKSFAQPYQNMIDKRYLPIEDIKAQDLLLTVQMLSFVCRVCVCVRERETGSHLSA